jgi:hypothetical protein
MMQFKGNCVDLLGEEIEVLTSTTQPSHRGQLKVAHYEGREHVHTLYLGNDRRGIHNHSVECFNIFVRDDFTPPDWELFEGSVANLIGKEVRVSPNDSSYAAERCGVFGTVQEVVVDKGRLSVKLAEYGNAYGKIYVK